MSQKLSQQRCFNRTLSCDVIAVTPKLRRHRVPSLKKPTTLFLETGVSRAQLFFFLRFGGLLSAPATEGLDTCTSL